MKSLSEAAVQVCFRHIEAHKDEISEIDVQLRFWVGLQVVLSQQLINRIGMFRDRGLSL